MNTNIQDKDILQNTDTEIFILDKNDSSNKLQTAEYMLVEVKFDDIDIDFLKQNLDIYPILCYDYDKTPMISYNPKMKSVDVSTCNGFNYNQYMRINGQYFLRIQLDNQAYDQIRIIVFVTGMQVQYNIKFNVKYQDQLQDICPFNCYNNLQKSQGTCSYGDCECNQGTLDEDCSANAKLISTKQTKVLVDNNKMQYLYFKPQTKVEKVNEVNDIIINFVLAQAIPPIQVFITVEGTSPPKLLPTDEIFLDSYSISSENYSLTLKAQGQFDAKGNPRTTVIGCQILSRTMTSNSMIVQIIDSPEDISNTNMIIIFFLVGVVSLLFLIWIILTIIKIRYARRNQVIDLTVAQQQRQGQRRNNNKLTMELIDQFMPCLTFEQIKKNNNEKKSLNDACAVCLCEFENDDVCRTATCNHFFHKDCLEQWLKKQENCPFCRADLSRQTLEKKLLDNNDIINLINNDQIQSQQSSQNQQNQNNNNNNNNNIINNQTNIQQQNNQLQNDNSPLQNGMNINNASSNINLNPRNNIPNPSQQSSNVRSSSNNNIQGHERGNSNTRNQLVVSRNALDNNSNSASQPNIINNINNIVGNVQNNRNSLQIQELDLN